MGSLDRGGHGAQDRYGERAETRPPSLEQLINETRAERDAFRCDPANWDKVDPANFPDRKRYAGESQPWTAEELEQIEWFPGDEWDPPGRAFAAGLDRAGQADRGSDVERPVAGEAEQDRDYHSTEDIRDGLLSGKSVPEVRRELLDQPDGPAEEKTTELVRTEGDLRYERGNPDELPEAFEFDDSDKSLSEKVNGLAQRRETVQGLDRGGKEYGRILQAIDPPKTTGTSVGMPHQPVAHAPSRDVDGSAVIMAPLVFYFLGRSLKHKLDERKPARGDRSNAGD